MEKSVKAVTAGLLLAVFSITSNGQTLDSPAKRLEDFQKRFPPVKKNASAEEIERLAPSLGIDWSPRGEEHPTKDDIEALRQAEVGSWLETQIKTSDDSIGPPPAKIQNFISDRRAVFGRVVAILRKEVPEWGYDVRDSNKARRELVTIGSLNRILAAIALVDERAGHHVEAGELLDASWSLYRSLAWRPDLLSQLVVIGLLKNQIGTLRKLSEPPYEWLDRVSGDTPWQRFLDALRDDPLVMRSSGFASWGSLFDPWARGSRAVAENLRILSPCQISKLSDDDIWLPMGKELHQWKESEVDTYQATEEVFKAITTPNWVPGIHREVRLLVDRELTLKILELRQERAASRDGVWPEKFLDTLSRVCPEASFDYVARDGGMSIRFPSDMTEGDQPGLTLPLSFEARFARPTPTPKRPLTGPTPPRTLPTS